LDPDAIVANFAACTIPREEWTHTAHLVVGLWHVERYGCEGALSRLRLGIGRLNDVHGTPNSTRSGYHETVTRAYVTLLAEFVMACPEGMPMPDRVNRLLASPLAGKNALTRFYSPHTLASEYARVQWIEPDVAPLRLATLIDS
jgi:hypothetical protein